MSDISVIIPTYNRAETIVRAIESALRQTYPILEILVCDDGSTDNTENIIKLLQNPKIQFVNCGRNGLPAVPRNRGIKLALGKWLAFLDSDDEWLPNKIESQLEAMKNDNTLASSTNAIRIINNQPAGNYFLSHLQPITFSTLLNSNQNICSSVVIAKSLLENISGFPEELNHKGIEDYAFWLRISIYTDFSYLQDPFLYYFDAPDHSIRKNSSSFQSQHQIIIKGLHDWVNQSNIKLSQKKIKLLNEALKKQQVKNTWLSFFKSKI